MTYSFHENPVAIDHVDQNWSNTIAVFKDGLPISDNERTQLLESLNGNENPEYTHATVQIVDGVRKLVVQTRGIQGEFVLAEGVMPRADYHGKVIRIIFQTDPLDGLPGHYKKADPYPDVILDWVGDKVQLIRNLDSKRVTGDLPELLVDQAKRCLDPASNGKIRLTIHGSKIAGKTWQIEWEPIP